MLTKLPQKSRQTSLMLAGKRGAIGSKVLKTNQNTINNNLDITISISSQFNLNNLPSIIQPSMQSKHWYSIIWSPYFS